MGIYCILEYQSAQFRKSVKISNNFLYLMAGFAILIAAVIVSYVSRKFTDPILELNDIAKKNV